MARKIEVGFLGVAALMIVGKLVLDDPEAAKQASKDAVEIVAETGNAVKDETLDAVNTTGTGGAPATSIVPAQVAGG
jgi:hypothetical protein